MLTLKIYFPQTNETLEGESEHEILSRYSPEQQSKIVKTEILSNRVFVLQQTIFNQDGVVVVTKVLGVSYKLDVLTNMIPKDTIKITNFYYRYESTEESDCAYELKEADFI